MQSQSNTSLQKLFIHIPCNLREKKLPFKQVIKAKLHLTFNFRVFLSTMCLYIPTPMWFEDFGAQEGETGGFWQQSQLLVCQEALFPALPVCIQAWRGPLTSEAEGLEAEHNLLLCSQIPSHAQFYQSTSGNG